MWKPDPKAIMIYPYSGHLADTFEKFFGVLLSLGRVLGVIAHNSLWTWYRPSSLRFQLLSATGIYLVVLTVSSFAFCVPLVYQHFIKDSADVAGKEGRLFERVATPLHFLFKLSVFFL